MKENKSNNLHNKYLKYQKKIYDYLPKSIL